MVVALVNSGDVSLARGDREGSDTLSFSSKGKVGDRSTSHGIPNVNSGHFTALTSSNDVSVLSSSDIKSGDIVLMDWPVWKILFSVLVFFTTTEESLLSSGQVLDNGESGSRKHDLIVVFSEIGASLVSISRETVNMLNFVSAVWFAKLGWVSNSSGWRLLIDLLQEELLLWNFSWFVLLHF